jgi:hypothetical protein
MAWCFEAMLTAAQAIGPRWPRAGLALLVAVECGIRLARHMLPTRR